MTLSEKLEASAKEHVNVHWYLEVLKEGARIALLEQERRMMNEAEFFPWSPGAMLRELEQGGKP